MGFIALFYPSSTVFPQEGKLLVPWQRGPNTPRQDRLPQTAMESFALPTPAQHSHPPVPTLILLDACAFNSTSLSRVCRGVKGQSRRKLQGLCICHFQLVRRVSKGAVCPGLEEEFTRSSDQEARTALSPSRFLDLGTTDILSQIILCRWCWGPCALQDVQQHP